MPEFSMQCPHCNSKIENIPEEKEGQIITCMECGKTVQAVSGTPPANSETVPVKPANDIILGDKVSDSEMDGFESFEPPEEEEEIIEAELIRDRFPWRTAKFMGIVCDVLFLAVACEIAVCAYLIYQAQLRKTDDLPKSFAQKRLELKSAHKKAQDQLDMTRKKIQAQIKADEKEEAVFHTKQLLAATEQLQKVKINFPAKIDPAQKPFLKENPYLFFLDALKTYSLVDNDTRLASIAELTQRLKNTLEEIKEQQKYDRVAVVEEIIEPFLKEKIDLSEVSLAAKAVIQFEKDEKIRKEQEARDKIRREKERIAAIERKRQEALKNFADGKNQLHLLTKQLYAIEDKLDFADLHPGNARTLFSNIFLEKCRNANGSAASLEQMLNHAAKFTDIDCSREDAETMCKKRFNEIEKQVLQKFSAKDVRAKAEKTAEERYPAIKRGQNVLVVYLEGNARYSFRGPFIHSDERGIKVGGRTFPWNKLETECRKKLDPQERKKAINTVINNSLIALRNNQERERNRLREDALRQMFQSGVVMMNKEIHSTASFFKMMYPTVIELCKIRKELERTLTQMYPVTQRAVKREDKNFVSGLQEEFGLKDHSNIGKAIQFYEKAAQKCVEAQVRLGDIYSAPRNSIRGIDPNRRKALRYYRMAAKSNNEYAKKRIQSLTEKPAAKNAKKQLKNKKK